MVQLVPVQLAKIDRDLEHALREWGRLPEIESSIDSWQADEVVDFVFEWTIEEDRLQRLSAHAERDELTDEQLSRFQQLEALVHRHRPIIERLISA